MGRKNGGVLCVNVFCSIVLKKDNGNLCPSPHVHCTRIRARECAYCTHGPSTIELREVFEAYVLTWSTHAGTNLALVKRWVVKASPVRDAGDMCVYAHHIRHEKRSNLENCAQIVRACILREL